MDQSQTYKRPWIKTVLISTVLTLVLVGAYFSGYTLGRQEGRTRPQPPAGSGRVVGTATGTPAWLSQDVSFNLYWDLWNIIQTRFIDKPVEEPKLFYGSLAGMVAALEDPYSVFLPPKDAEEFTEELQGRFEGIGAEIGIRDNRLTVISPLPESPAEQAGLKPADWIIAIDGFDTKGINLNNAVKRIRGEKGTTVILKIWRDGFEEEKEFSIIRDEIKIVSVRWEMKDGGIGYIKITNFNSDSGARFYQAIEDMFAKKPRGIILDMRNDPGGFLEIAVEIASYWVEEGRPVVLEKSVERGTVEYRATRNQSAAGMPTVVLVNRGSASASEIVAGALQDYGLATIVGETTFGKGSIQDLKDLSDGSAVKLTIARWLTPKEREIDKEGIKPDVEVEMEEEDVKESKDPQLDKALEILKSKVQSFK